MATYRTRDCDCVVPEVYGGHKKPDLAPLTTQAQKGKEELERRVGPVRAKNESMPRDTWGTAANPWVTVNALPCPGSIVVVVAHPFGFVTVTAVTGPPDAGV